MTKTTQPVLLVDLHEAFRLVPYAVNRYEAAVNRREDIEHDIGQLQAQIDELTRQLGHARGVETRAWNAMVERANEAATAKKD